MDFIERWLGLSPDDGSGWFEAVLLITLAAALAYRRRRQRQTR